MTDPLILPVLSISGKVAFPQVPLVAHSINKHSAAAVSVAEMLHDGYIIVVAQEEDKGGLYNVGVLCKVDPLPKSLNAANIEGIKRVRIVEWINGESYLKAKYEEIPDECSAKTPQEVGAFIRALLTSLNKYFEYENSYKLNPPDSLSKIEGMEDPRAILYSVAQYMDRRILRLHQKQCILEEPDLILQTRIVLEVLENERQTLEIHEKVKEEIRKSIKENRRAAIQRQIEAMRSQLGEDDTDLATKYEHKIKALPISDETKKVALEEVAKLRKLYGSNSIEVSLIESYLEFFVNMPWGRNKKKDVSIAEAREILEREHYGIEEVKRRVLRMVGAEKMSGKPSKNALLLVGPPGIGKTTLARCIAKATGREFWSISCGGLDESDFKGHRKTYVGAMPGMIASGLYNVGCQDPVMLLDELGDLAETGHKAPMKLIKAMLNGDEPFVDLFLNARVPLDNVLFIFTSNSDNMPAAVLDRCTIIYMDGYTEEQKVIIAKEYLMPRMRAKYKLTEDMLHFSDECIRIIVAEYTGFEAGVRTLERVIDDIGQWACVQFVERGIETLVDGQFEPLEVGAHNLDTILVDSEKIHVPYYSTEDAVGRVNGLAWTAAGGVILPIEALILSTDNEKRKITGNLGKVMQESITVALGVLENSADKFGIDPKMFKSTVNVHYPSGAIPKDGPSAGISVFCCLLSAFTGFKIKHDIAMTGELTLLRKVLPVGGIKEKLTAAKKIGMKKVLMSSKNRQNVEKHKEALEGLEIVFCDDVMELIPHIFCEEDLKLLAKGQNRFSKSVAKDKPTESKSSEVLNEELEAEYMTEK